ncbi:MAG: PDR/VanB family oxidoreductase [Pseudomonadota bacterium]
MADTYRIDAIHDETDRIRIFDLVPADGRAIPDFAAGAHIEISIPDVGPRAYSLIQWPDEPRTLRIAVQREDTGDGGSLAMHRLAVGEDIKAGAPKNDFPLDSEASPAVLIAGGIGVTPLISMATALSAANRPFAFHYAGRTREAMGFLGRLSAFGASRHVHPDDASPIDLAQIAGDAPRDAHFYICGPKGMIDAARVAAENSGVESDQIHVELFETKPLPGEASFEVELSSTGDVVTVLPDQSIVEALEAAGHDVMYDCQRGDCGICQTDVISGEPDHRDVVLSQAEKDSGKVMQICVSRAKSPRLVLDL